MRVVMRVAALLAACLAAPAVGSAQYHIGRDRPFLGPETGPSGRPTGVPPNSGLLPGTPARPPGEPGAGTYSPVDPLPRHRPKVRSPSVEERADPPPVARQPRRRPPAVPAPRTGQR
jgi:hypothetical protein